jgi:hypothetical protein
VETSSSTAGSAASTPLILINPASSTALSLRRLSNTTGERTLEDSGPKPLTDAFSARSEREAFHDFATPLQRAAGAFAENVLFLRTGEYRRIQAHGLTLTGRRTVQLRGATEDTRLSLRADLYYRVVSASAAPRRWTVRTVAYIFQLEHAADRGGAILAYHWHPHVEGIGFPHIHLLAAGPEQGRLHIAAPHCTLLHVFTSAMRDFGVRPIRADWRQRLQEADSVLKASMEWAVGAWFDPWE